MAAVTEERLGELRRRIDSLEARARGSAGEARSRMQRHLDVLKDEQELARTSAHRHAGAVEAKLNELDIELDIAEHRLAAELAEDRDRFADAVEAELADWDAYLDRRQTKAASERGPVRDRAEQGIAELRERRLAAGESLAGAAGTTGEAWRQAKSRVLAELDELKHKADAARHG